MRAITRLVAILAVAGLFVAGVAEVRGQDIEWIGNGGDWLTADNWDLGRVPGTGDEVDINSSAAVVTLDNLTGDVVVDDIWIHQGELTVNTGNYKLETFQGTRNSGYWNHQPTIVGRGSGNAATFNMEGGEVSNRMLYVGHDNGTGTFNAYDGTLNVSIEAMVGFAGFSGRAATGILNVYRGATVEAGAFNFGFRDNSHGTVNLYGGAVIGNVRLGSYGDAGSSGTIRAWIDGGEFIPMTGDLLTIGWGTHFNSAARFEVAPFAGGVMLSGTDSFHVLNFTSLHHHDAHWTHMNVPDLWDLSHGGGQLSVALDVDRDRTGGWGDASLDAGTLGDQHWLGGTEQAPELYVDGHIGVKNLDEGEKNLLQLALGFSGEPEPAYIQALQDAGYTVWDPGALPLGLIHGYGYGVGERDPARLVGVDMWVDMDSGDTDGHFAWDLSAYLTANPSPLQLESVTVIPEPSTMVLLGIAGLVLALRRRRV